MDYASSFAVGAPQLEHHDAARRIDAGADVVLPSPRPSRMHWSTLLFVGGMVVCAIGLLATFAGVPARIAYDVDGAPNRNKPNSSDPLKLSASLDGNMKWMAANSSDEEGAYVYYIKSVNRSEAAIPAMVGALVTMNASVQSIDAGLAELNATTIQMGDDMDEMAQASAASAATMSQLSDDLGFLSASMVELADSTQELTQRMAGIEQKAAGIAANGTAEALKTTKDLNASLPGEVPVPTTTDGVPLDQAMANAGAGR